MKAEARPNGMPATRGTDANGRAIVMLAEEDYVRLLQMADKWEPPLPPADANGNFPANILLVDLARDIISRRRRRGLTHAELARRARIRLESLYLAENGLVPAPVRVIDKIARAFREIEAERAKDD